MRRLSAPSLRWAVPAAVVVAVGVGAGSAVVSASAEPKLPTRTAAQVLADLGSARVDGLSGTVVQHADLGLPELPNPGGGQGSADLSALISGSHTLRVWYAGKDKVRVALLGTLGESDVIRNGSDVWIWSSAQNTAQHAVLPSLAAGHRHDDHPDPAGDMPLTPQQAAQRALAAVDPTTVVRVDGAAEVAGRSAYELVLAPRDTRSLVGQVRIAVDAERHVPLRVQVIAQGHTSPALEIGYTHISFTRPGAQQFRFTPPPGARVTSPKSDAGTHQHSRADRPSTEPTTVGTGWTSVAVIGVPSGTAGTGHGRSGAATPPGALAPVLSAMPRVHGDWGSGRLLRSSLFTALLTDDGRLIVGMVGPDLIYQAAAHR